VKFRLVKLASLSGVKASIYSVIPENDSKTLLDHFISENLETYEHEIKNIASRLKAIGHKTGSREQFFKINEGKPGDGVCALYDDEERKLRLYCIRFGTCVLVLGGGGPKPPGMKAFQESEKLTQENATMRIVSKALDKRIRNKEISWSADQTELQGDFNFNDDE